MKVIKVKKADRKFEGLDIICKKQEKKYANKFKYIKIFVENSLDNDKAFVSMLINAYGMEGRNNYLKLNQELVEAIKSCDKIKKELEEQLPKLVVVF